MATSPFFVVSNVPSVLTEAAIRYAMKQLACRAGVADEVSTRWRIDLSDPGFVTVFIQSGTNKCIRFPRISEAVWRQIRSGAFWTSTAQWIEGYDDAGFALPDLKIPFASVPRTNVGPLFREDRENRVTCATDLLLSVIVTLSRFEETLPARRDLHGRFPSWSSIAWRDGFLDRPVVDEWGVAFQLALQSLLPGWRPAARCLRVKLGHDVDDIGIPFSFRSAAAKTLRDRRPVHTVRDCTSRICGNDTSGLANLKRLIDNSIRKNLGSAVYLKNSRRTERDAGYDLSDRRILKLIDSFSCAGVELGVHPSYFTFCAPELLRREVSGVRKLLGGQQVGGRQDYLRWCPDSWMHCENAGMAYDSSVGFADHIGFRAGTCIPYRPWLWSEQREANLIEIPLIATDAALRGYMKAKPGDALSLLRKLVARCKSVGGVFTLGWHNTTLMDSGYTKTYQTLLDEIAGSPPYDWRAAYA
jgi:hypothetical protein